MVDHLVEDAARFPEPFISNEIVAKVAESLFDRGEILDVSEEDVSYLLRELLQWRAYFEPKREEAEAVAHLKSRGWQIEERWTTWHMLAPDGVVPFHGDAPRVIQLAIIEGWSGPSKTKEGADGG